MTPDELLIEQPLTIDIETPVPNEVARWSEAGLQQAKKISCFDFVPSDAKHVWRVFASLPQGRFCEWGSGIGIATGIARMLGHQAAGIEINEELAENSRRLLQEYELDVSIHTGSYFDIHIDADYYFVYCWPGQKNQVLQHFIDTAPPAAKLLICNGAEDVRCRVRA